MGKMASSSKVEALVAKLVATIESGTHAEGSRVRSVRDAAQKERLGINTVVEAYSRLVARGYLDSRPGSGYYVRKVTQRHTHTPAAHVAQAIDVVSLLREQLEQHYAVRVGDGRPPAAWMSTLELHKLHQRSRVKPSGAPDHGYGSPWGFLLLRETIARVLADRSIPANSRQVLLTQGANHALDLIVRQFLEPGDKVLVDSPGYYPLFGKLKLAKIDMLPVPRTADGPDLPRLASLLQAHRPKAFFTQTFAHNPTGGSISLAKAHKLLSLTAEAGCMVVEDDPFADLLPDASARLAQLDQLEHVLYVSSFSKTLSAGLRVGYIAGALERIQALCDLKMLTVVSTSDVVERAVYELMVSGQYRRHLNRLKSRLHEAHAPAIKALARNGVTVHPSSPNGYYLWVQMPTELDDLQLARKAAQHGIFIAPGSVFYPDRKAPQPCMRVNVAYARDPMFLRFLKDALN